MRLIVLSRGWNPRYVGLLVASVAAAWLVGNVTVQLRTAANLEVMSPILDRGIVVGLTLPIVAVLRNFEDRLAWMLVTASRNAAAVRFAYAGLCIVGSVPIGVLLAASISGQASRLLVFSDFLLLLGTGIIACVVVGVQVAWLVPVSMALIASMPGLLPLAMNPLVRADAAHGVLLAAVVSLAVGVASFSICDDYLLGRQRLLRRTAGVTDD